MTTPSTSAQGPVAGSEPLTRAQWLMLPGHAQKRLNWLEAALASPSPAASPSGDAKLCPHAPTYDAGLCCGHPDDCTFVSPSTLASDATPAPTSGSEDGGDWRPVLTEMVAAMNIYGRDIGDGDIPSAHRSLMWRAEQLLAKPASEPAGGDVREALEALKPFSDIADDYADHEDDDFQVWKDFDVLGATLPLRIFRRARTAYQQIAALAPATEGRKS